MFVSAGEAISMSDAKQPVIAEAKCNTGITVISHRYLGDGVDSGEGGIGGGKRYAGHVNPALVMD